MTNNSAATESVVNAHLQAFLKQQDIADIIVDFDDNARLLTEAKIYRGKEAIHEFFVDFIGSLPADAINQFSLSSMQVDGDIAFVTWRVGDDIPLGTDTFVVKNGKIISHTFAMHVSAAQ
jgi:ketosteroid isomerase-like protein